jgi:DNA-binding NtrC family response regulator
MELNKSRDSDILVVDDDADILSLFRDNLINLGLNVQTASSATDALKSIDFKTINCIVTDIMMPEMTGVEFIKKLEELGHKKIVFFITGYKDWPREELNQFNPKAIIFKPFDVEEAAILIKNHLKR